MITSLTINCSQLPDRQLDHLATSIMQLEHLKELSVTSNRFATIPEEDLLFTKNALIKSNALEFERDWVLDESEQFN